MKACRLVPVRLQKVGTPRTLPIFMIPAQARYTVTNANKPGHPKAGEVYGTVHRLSPYQCAMLSMPVSKPWGFLRAESGSVYGERVGYRTRQAAVDALVGTHLNPYADPDRYKS